MKTKYEWGVEYPTNGKRPDLPGDVEVFATGGNYIARGIAARYASWGYVKSFTITDPRYKPAGTNYLNAPTQAQSLTHKAADEVSDGFASREEMAKHSVLADFDDLEQSKSSWHDRGELPPVGIECESYDFTHSQWVKVKTLDAETGSKELACVTTDEDGTYGRLFWGCRFRPIRTEREKVIEVAVKIYDDKKCFSAESFASELHKAGMLVLPSKKSDTED